MSDLVYDLDNAPGFLLGRTAMRLKSGLRRAFLAAGHDITPEQWAVLCRLWIEEGVTQSDLADRTFKDKTTMTRILGGLEAKGLVTRQRDVRDRRNIRVRLTPAGWALRDQLIPVVKRYAAESFASVPPEDMAVLKRVLATIYDGLK